MTSFKKKLLVELGIGLAIIIPLVGGTFFFSGQIEKFGDQIGAARKELFSRTAGLDEVAALRAEYNEKTKRYLEVLRALVPVRDQLINLARDFQILSAQSHLTSSFTFLGDTPPAGGSLGSLAFRLNLRGKLEDLFAFIGQFDKFRYLSALSSFSVSRGAEESAMLTHGSVYYR